jgi:hypothetical protein
MLTPNGHTMNPANPQSYIQPVGTDTPLLHAARPARPAHSVMLAACLILGCCAVTGGCARKFTFDKPQSDGAATSNTVTKSGESQRNNTTTASPDADSVKIPVRVIFTQPSAGNPITTMRQSADGKLVQRRELRAVSDWSALDTERGNEDQTSREPSATPAAAQSAPQWSIRLLKPVAPAAAGDDSAHKPATTLALSLGGGGEILLHSLVDARRSTRTLFEPPLVLLPAELTSAAEHTATGTVTVLRDNDKRSKLDSGKVVAQARLVKGNCIETLLTLELSASTIQQRREYYIAADEHNKQVVVREVESLRVNVGPLNIIDDTATWIPSAH